MAKRGYFITFEGPEGSGKTTQSKMLYEALLAKEYQAYMTREPGGLPEAEAIRGILKDTENKGYDLTDRAELYLFSAARNMFVSKVVIPRINEGINVISDRFADSTRAYQGYAGGIEMKLIERMIAESTEGVSPDLTFIIDVDPAVGLSKETEGGRFSMKSLAYHQKVRNGYLDIAAKNPKRCVVFPRIEGEMQQTHEKIMQAVHERLGL